MCEDVKDILAKLITRSEREFVSFLKEQEIEETQVHQRISDTIALTELVKSRREAFELMSSKFFKEKDRLSKMAIKSLDVAISQGDDELANIILNFLNVVYKEKYPKISI
ncbi:MAG: hypothetical protein MR593_00825 [Intestinibacter sp.]|uniref:hypothetical protein n=1 Tax=Intestinibacter sp. TaxID=1965304 RepID=UPI0025BC908B|nr:hypothetical protein [Intestinibacter sp.]MCI6736653.1 hypothetical protein [Intestinibacter sp.]